VIDLSVVVVSWNSRELTDLCLAHLEDALVHVRDRDGLESEIIVVDNGSRDGTFEMLSGRHPEVARVELGTNRGFAGGANSGLSRARGRIVLLLNTDAWVDSVAIAACLAEFEREPNVGVVGPQLLHGDGRLQNSAHVLPSLASELAPTWLPELLWPARFPSKRRPPCRPVDVQAITGAALFVRREVIEQVGSLCEDYFFFLEETDWCRRIRLAGWRIRLVPTARVVHLSGASSKRRDPIRTRIEFHRSLYHFLRVHRGERAAMLVRWLRVAKNVGAVALLSLAAPFSAPYRGRLGERWWLLVWHWRGRPDDWGLEVQPLAPARPGTQGTSPG
jgi:GT2 family glycosyltransferase